MFLLTKATTHPNFANSLYCPFNSAVSVAAYSLQHQMVG